MRYNVSGKVIAACALVLSADCGSNSASGPEILGPLTHVRAFEVTSEAQAVAVKAGAAIKLAVREYDAINSQPSFRAVWTTRNAAVASNNSADVTAIGTGQTSIVAKVVDNGRTFSDSVQITVLAP